MSLLVWLPLDGNLNNQGLSNINVINNGATVNTSGKIGSCYSFNGSNNYLYTSYNFYNSTYSVCAWIYTTSSSATQTIVCDRTTVGCGFSIFLIGGKIRIDCGGNNLQWTTAYTYPINTWFHLTVTYDGTTVYYYINGEFKEKETQTLDSSYWGTVTSIGASQMNGSGYGNYLNGRLNDIRIYNYALSVTEIREISQGLILHYKLDSLPGANLIVNGMGSLDGYGWNSPNNISTDIPSGQPNIKRSIYSNTSKDFIEICQDHAYSLEVWIKNSGTSGNTYPSIYAYDADKNAIQYYQNREGFNLNTMTQLTQPLNPGDTQIHVADLSAWNANSGHYYNRAAIFSYRDSTGYLYPDGTYTRNTPSYGSSTSAKTNLDKTNNIITLNSAYTGPFIPAGTSVCSATDGSTYLYPFGGISKASINEWTYKSATLVPKNINRLKNAKYIKYSTYDGTLHAGIKLIDTSVQNVIIDSSGYNNYGEIYQYDESGVVESIDNSPRYEHAIYINSNNNTTNTASGTCYIYGHCSLTTPSQMSVAFWCKPEAGYSGGTTQGQFCTTKVAFGDSNAGSDYQASAMNHRDSTVDINDSASSTQCRPSISFTANEWHHYCITYDGQVGKVYKDGIQTSTAQFSAPKTLDSFIGVIIGFSKAGGVWRSNKSNYSDFRVYCTCLLDNDIKQLYNVSMKVDKKQNIHAFKIQEQERNLMSGINFALANKEFVNGLSRYTQANCQVTLTDEGFHIYRPPNLTTANNGNTMYGGIQLYNSTVNNIHTYDPSKDNIWGLQKGHTYIWIFHVKGITNNAPGFQITNNMGWGGHGMSPAPTVLATKNIPSNFSGETEVWYKFTINDDIVKICTSSYSSFVVDNEYLSYKHFGWNWSYASTGANGTDIYVTNIRLYDITNTPLMGKITKEGLAKFSSIFEINETIHINKNEDVILNQFIER